MNNKVKNEKERKVTVIGRPSVENLSKDEQKSFYSTILLFIVDYYQKEKKSDK